MHILNILNLVSVHHGVCVLNLVSIQLCVHTAVVNFGIFKIQILNLVPRYGRTSIILSTSTVNLSGSKLAHSARAAYARGFS